MARGGARGGRAAQCGSLTRLRPGPRLLRSPNRTLASPDSQGAVCKHTCTSWKVVSPIPPSARRPWRRSAPGPSPRSRREDKRAAGPSQPAGISFSHHRGRGNPRGQVKDERRAPGGGDREVAAGRLVSKSGKAKVEVSALWVRPGCPGGWRDGSRARGIRYSEESPGGG